MFTCGEENTAPTVQVPGTAARVEVGSDLALPHQGGAAARVQRVRVNPSRGLARGRAETYVRRMARPLRLEFPGAIYHITARGNAKDAIYLDDDDRNRFLTILARVVKRYEWLCHAYCLMGNHYHLVLETPRPSLAAGMQHLNGVYAQGFNQRHDRVGHV